MSKSQSPAGSNIENRPVPIGVPSDRSAARSGESPIEEPVASVAGGAFAACNTRHSSSAIKPDVTVVAFETNPAESASSRNAMVDSIPAADASALVVSGEVSADVARESAVPPARAPFNSAPDSALASIPPVSAIGEGAPEFKLARASSAPSGAAKEFESKPPNKSEP